MNLTKERYNKKPYLSKVFSFTQHYRQRAIMEFLGLETPNIHDARILEIGCSYGGNIINTAVFYPNCEIIGLDIAEEHIVKGNELIKKIGLNNIKLYAMDIMDYNGEFGKFDYIICHGVFSWVNERVQEKILKVIKESLCENGSALISYNTYPGWKKTELLRDIICFREKMLRKQSIIMNEEDRIGYAKGAMEFLCNFSEDNEELKELANIFMDKDDYYLYHELLEDNNKPMYIYDFNKKLKNIGLIHVTDSDLNTSNGYFLKKDVRDKIIVECGDDYIAKEQYYDFMFDNTFRYSLVTHENNIDKLNLKGYISQKNLDNLFLDGRYVYDKKSGNYKYGNVEIKNEKYKKIIEQLNLIYPNNINSKDLVGILGEEIYGSIVNMIVGKLVKFSTEKNEIKKTKGKIKINKKNYKYFSTCIENYDKIVGGSKNGEVLTLLECMVILLFDGSRTLEEIKEETIVILEREFKNEIRDKNTDEKFIDLFVNEVLNTILLTEEYEVV